MSLTSLKKSVRTNGKYIVYVIPIVIVLFAITTFVSALIVNNARQYMYDSPEDLTDLLTGDTRVGLVLGGGIGVDQQPTDVVKSRLDAAAQLYFEDAINLILVSGDNRFTNYNEPQVMQNYLQDNYDIPLTSIQQDNAGRSTYESCDRAKNVFQLDQLIVISQQSHVPRAIYLCRSFGIETYGYPSAISHHRLSQSLREMTANIKAVYNVHIKGEPTIYGEPIPL